MHCSQVTKPQLVAPSPAPLCSTAHHGPAGATPALVSNASDARAAAKTMGRKAASSSGDFDHQTFADGDPPVHAAGEIHVVGRDDGRKAGRAHQLHHGREDMVG